MSASWEHLFWDYEYYHPLLKEWINVVGGLDYFRIKEPKEMRVTGDKKKNLLHSRVRVTMITKSGDKFVWKPVEVYRL